MKYFTEQELECQHCGERKIDPDFMAIIGWNQKGEHNKRFVHLDIAESSGLPSPTIWTY